MNNQKLIDRQSKKLPNPEDLWQDDWVLSRKSIHAGGLIVEHHIEPASEIRVSATNHHLLCYQLNNFSPRQITRIDGKEYDGTCKRGSIWLKPSLTDGFWHWESTDECLMFAIAPAFLKRVALENDCLNSEKIEILPVIKAHNPKLNALAMEFVQEMNNSEFGNRIYIESLTNIFAVLLLRHYCVFPTHIEEIKGGLSPYQKQQVIDYIQANISQEIGGQQICELIGLSQFHFVREFKKSVGVTPHQYVIQQRVEMAKRLLKQPGLSITDVAIDCGFADQSHLGRIFKKQTGTTPKRYRLEV